MRAVVVTLGVLLSLAAAVFTAAAISLFVDGNGGAGGFAVFVALVCLLCAVLLFRASPRRAAPRQQPRQQRRQGGPGTGFYHGDSTPSYGWTAASTVGDDRSWGGDAGADTGAGHHGPGGPGGSGHHGHVDSSGWSGSDGGSSGGSGGSDGGSGGSDGGGGY